MAGISVHPAGNSDYANMTSVQNVKRQNAKPTTREIVTQAALDPPSEPEKGGVVDIRS